MMHYVAALGIIIDFAVFFLIWKAKGKPLPQRLEWMRRHRITAWLCDRMESSWFLN